MTITKNTLLAVVSSVTAFSGWAQDNTTATSGDNLVVTANRFPQPVSSVLASTSIVTKDDIDRWQSKNLLEVMRRLPGVDIAQTGGLGQSASLYVRGSEARHTLVLIDGVPIAKPGITGVADFNQIPISLVQRIEFIRGPRSAVYGADAIGGVINIITQTDADRANLTAGLGSNRYQEYSGSFQRKVNDNTRVTVAGAFQDSKGYNIQPNSTYSVDSDRDGWGNKSFWAGIEHKFSEQVSGFVRGYGYGASSDYDAGSAGSPDEQQIYNHTYDGGLRYQQDSFASQIVASYQKYKTLNYLSTEGRYADSNSLDDMEQRNVQWGNTLALGHGMVSAGLNWKQQKLVSTGLGYDSVTYLPYRAGDNYKQDNTGAYVTAQQQFDTITVEGALRGDDNEDFGTHGTWQTAIAWEFIPEYRLGISYGTAFQAPTLGQLYGQRRFGIASNEHLKPEESKQWEASLEATSGPLHWRLAAYHNKTSNLIDYYYNTLTSSGAYYNIKAATMKGLEWNGDFDTGIFNHQITLGYLDARRDEDNEVLARRAKQQAKYQLSWVMYDFDFDVSYQYFGKRFDNNTSIYNTEQRRLPSYSTVDLAVSYPVTSHLTVRGRIANLFDKDYETAYGYATPGREYYLTGSYTF
ncbi:TPA: TonB-dependent vitamin B12 receptor BtuB [Serratia marcescens]|uniref:Vitamin B12 transporter BtuB n=1 Tax=Serratia marcescens TaxID=615 RepID=A0AB33G2U7_SERMA|nr:MULTISPECIES: TonB-dependent vitamin B12 receptor BtuB [Serratia]AKL44156.1 vitamin B12/cobalamin outer membrane transporter [Serratia marcescens]AWL71490.1 TonB-dependent vitamin B12 receptor BtuB [Serratia marcescens]MDP8607515.1 TonB-dependent vitamin B12 receptor BtuB [Serratia marcescens]MDP8876144.1 TonB-dependent vitamin B12 receptor BtuB [Serratia marcescens]UBI61956.1 TonB-dependent vitamin B12 receptor BtuB [Serratia sp. HRI]